jgi:ornithine cyclodeaminase/alanine dehydrogenase-like protein (mu-crystallin family)
LDKLESTLKGLWKERDERVDLTIRVTGQSGWQVEDEVRAAEVIVTATPSTIPLFPAEAMDTPSPSHIDLPKPKTIILIGSYKPHMLEIPPSIITDLLAAGGKVTVDSREACLAEAGELQGLQGGDVVELGELLGSEGDGMEGEGRLNSVRSGRVRVFKSVSLRLFSALSL